MTTPSGKPRNQVRAVAKVPKVRRVDSQARPRKPVEPDNGTSHRSKRK